MARIALAIALVTVSLVAWLGYRIVAAPLAIEAATVIDVPRGATGRRVATAASSFVDERLFMIYVRLTEFEGPIRAGEYAIEPGMSLRDLVSRLRHGEVVSYRLTFPEGLTFDEWRDVIAGESRLVATLADAANDNIMVRLGHPGQDPEGRFFPDTYHFQRGDSDLDILQRAFDRMQSVIDEAWRERSSGLPFANADEALILASIVEKETGLESDRGLIASVFINRLQRNMRLQSDPTVIYGIRHRFDGNIRRRDLADDHDYNTYVHGGLPPGPICMPGLASIRAVLQPEASDFLYFVARGDGASHFSRTLEEHNDAVDRYQRRARSAAP